ncbi:MAG: hypothetical protein M3R38_18025 [Actinomycetota bacterium]|nr:hypothetical protein [Actinomycetota bacterium]
MHGFTRGLERRLKALEQRLGTVVEPETAAATNRRAELCRAALAGEIPEDLRESEKLTFSRIVASVPIFEELRDEGIIDGHGEPAGADPHHEDPHEDPHEPVWRP